jgi:hypothetical protein
MINAESALMVATVKIDARSAGAHFLFDSGMHTFVTEQ